MDINETNSQIVQFESIRGKPKIACNGFIYTFNRISKDLNEVYRCENRKCYGSLKLGPNKKIIHESLHSHDKNWEKIERLKINKKVKKIAKETSYDPKSIYTNIRKEFNEEIIQKIKPKTLYKYISKNRQNNRGETTFVFSNLPDFFKFTNSGKKFLYHNELKNSESLFMLYTVLENIQHASHSNTWLCDSTFNITPKEYYQFLTIHVRINNSIFPCFYVLMKDKQQSTYEKIFIEIKKLVNKTPEFFIVDFEQAQKNAIENVFEQTKIYYCLFHFGQCIFRKIQKLGLSIEYRTNITINKICKMLTSLAFVPEEFVQEEFKKLKDSFDYEENINLKNLFIYFEENFILGIFNKKSWSAYQRLEKEIPLTTNNLETYHRAFKRLFNNSHPSLWNFIECLKNRQEECEIAIRNSYINPILKNSYNEKILKMQKLALKFNDFYGLNYLDIMSTVYGWHFEEK